LTKINFTYLKTHSQQCRISKKFHGDKIPESPLQGHGKETGRKRGRDGRESEKGKDGMGKGKGEGQWVSPTLYFRLKSCTVDMGTTKTSVNQSINHICTSASVSSRDNMIHFHLLFIMRIALTFTAAPGMIQQDLDRHNTNKRSSSKCFIEKPERIATMRRLPSSVFYTILVWLTPWLHVK